MRPIQQSVAQLRAQKEMSSLNSQRQFDGSMSQHGSAAHQRSGSQGLHAQMSQGGGTENASRVYSADQLDAAGNVIMPKTIISYLNDKITAFLMSGKDEELGRIKIEGDLVTQFFDNVDMISDTTLYAFLEELKQDKELIVSILFNSVNEVVVFFSYMIVMLKRLHPMAHSFNSTMQMVKELTQQINDEYGTTLPAFLTQGMVAQL